MACSEASCRLSRHPIRSGCKSWQAACTCLWICLFYKYVNFIDTYAGIEENERDILYREIAGQEDTAMLAQYFLYL